MSAKQQLDIVVQSLQISGLERDPNADWFLTMRRRGVCEIGLRLTNDERRALIKALGGTPKARRL